ncbi:MAG TPA: protein kinase [Patescibacteria group bacterium]|nr:protein kinase [Patescibacteria group bacterium]
MINQTISHYKILQELGRGGMGEIYLAEDTKLERQVALKFLPRHMTDDKEARLRFEREAKAAAALNHPNIVTVYEIGEHDDQVFIAMEYVEGRTLKEMISGSVGADPRVCPGADNDRKKGEHRGSPLRITPHPLPLTQVIDIATQISSGLAAAHAKGIVHRDIKPQNILMDKNARVKILDFGLAKLKGVSPLTQKDFTMGTVHYMSPEQGQGKEVDPRSDIWSLGVMLYEMISGGLPFLGEYDQAVIYAIVNEEMAPLLSGKEQLPAGIEKIIRCCLAKKRQDRYPSAEALAAALRDLNEVRAATKPEKSSGRRLSRRAFLTALSLLLLSGILGFFALNPRASSELRRVLGLSGLPRSKHMAVLPLLTTGDDAEAKALGDGFTTVIIDKLTWLEKFHDSLWTVPAGEVFENRGKPPRALRRLWGCNLFISGDLQTENNSLRLRLKLQDARSGRALRQVELQGNIANLTLFQEGLISKLLKLINLPEEDGTVTYVNAGGTAMPGAYILFIKGRGWIMDRENGASIDQAIRSLERALQQDNRYLQARLGLVEALIAKSQLSKDPGWLRLAEDQGLMLNQDASQWAPAQLSWAVLLDLSHKKAEARKAWQQALRLDEHCYRAGIELANSYSDEGRTGEAEKYYKQAIQVRPAYPMAYENLAYFYYINGRYDEALDFYQKVVELAPGDINGFINMGGMYMKKGDREKARLMFEKANAIQPDPAAQSNLATLYFYEGEYRKALPLFSALARETNDYIMWGNLADTYRQLPDQREKAGAAYRKAIALAEVLLAATPGDSEIISCLALYRAHQGEKNKALEAISRARTLAPANLEMIRRAILVHEAVGERSQSLDALREYRERLGGMDEIEKEPDLAALRADPSYLELLSSPH